MRKQAELLRRAGRFGDTELVHVNARELRMLEQMWGRPTRNPATSLPEFFDLGGILGWLAPVVTAGAAEAIGGAGTLGSIGEFLGAGSDWASTLGGAGVGALTGGITNAVQGKDILTGALTGGVTGAAVPTAGKALGFGGFGNTPWNVPTLFDVGSMFDASKVAGGAAGALDPMLNGDANLGGAGFQSSADAAKTAGAGNGGGGGALGWIKKNPWAIPVAMAGITGLLGQASGAPQQQQQTKPGAPQRQSYANYQFPTFQYNRRMLTPQERGSDPYRYFADNRLPDVPISAARGGEINGGALSDYAQGRVAGPGDGRSDDVNARVSNKEYVVDAESMALLGNGDPDSGADKMDRLRVNLRKHKGKSLARGKFSPDAKSVEGYLS